MQLLCAVLRLDEELLLWEHIIGSKVRMSRSCITVFALIIVAVAMRSSSRHAPRFESKRCGQRQRLCNFLVTALRKFSSLNFYFLPSALALLHLSKLRRTSAIRISQLHRTHAPVIQTSPSSSRPGPETRHHHLDPPPTNPDHLIYSFSVEADRYIPQCPHSLHPLPSLSIDNLSLPHYEFSWR